MRHLAAFLLLIFAACGSVSQSRDLRDARYVVVLHSNVSFGGETAICADDSLELRSERRDVNRFALSDIAFIERPPNAVGRWIFGAIGVPVGALIGGATGLAIVSGSIDSDPKAFVYGIVTGAVAGFAGGVALWERIDSDRLNVAALPASERRVRVESFIK
ncbi:MAG: hypothetical protein NZM06_10770 [Chloroherpetonaceae bacterium]|nr:hypothetical protein [Chloroherpetonaceae bacterium]MDW8438187.1 hypothetical protein [Chloroherpetonaceae bacterium]